jgi:Ca2+-binding EF-hand superfamily protein
MATKQEKMEFTFKIYDVDGNGSIDEEELYLLLKDVIRSDKNVSKHFGDEQVKKRFCF